MLFQWCFGSELEGHHCCSEERDCTVPVECPSEAEEDQGGVERVADGPVDAMVNLLGVNFRAGVGGSIAA